MGIKLTLCTFHWRPKKTIVTTFLTFWCLDKKIWCPSVLIRTNFMCYRALQLSILWKAPLTSTSFTKGTFQTWMTLSINMSSKCAKSSSLKDKNKICWNTKLFMHLMRRFICLADWLLLRMLQFLPLQTKNAWIPRIKARARYLTERIT